MSELRAATASDNVVLGAILSSWIAETPWMPKLHSPEGDVKFLARKIGEGGVSVAMLEGQAAGFLSRDGTEVDMLYLGGAYRGRGVGKTLLNAAKAQSPVLELWTFQQNHGAQAFYAREGFREIKRTDGAGNEEKLPDVRLAWGQE
jgi:GNAT superfamily N-acetyltransferase